MLSTTEVAIQLRVTRQTIMNWIKSGYIKATQVGRKYLIEQSEVERLLGGDK